MNVSPMLLTDDENIDPALTASAKSMQQQHGSSIRTRFLFRLGFDTVLSNEVINSLSACHAQDQRRFCPESYQEALKDVKNGRKDRDSSFGQRPQQHSSRANFLSSRNPKASVSFCSYVTVIPIPSHNDYSDRIKRSMWTGSSELQEQVVRNCVEFAAEDWNWKQAVEDSDMILYDGQKVHPCHFGAEVEYERLSAQDHFLHCMAAQQAAQRDENPITGYSY